MKLSISGRTATSMALLLVVTVLGFGSGLWLLTPDAGPEPRVAGAPQVVAKQAPGIMQEDLHVHERSADVSVSSADLKPASAQPFLRDQFGDEWDEVRKLMLEMGVDPDTEIDPAIMIPLGPARKRWEDTLVFTEEQILEQTEHELAIHFVGVGDPLDILNDKRLEGVDEVTREYARIVGMQYELDLSRAAAHMIKVEADVRRRVVEEQLYSYGPLGCLVAGAQDDGVGGGGKRSITMDRNEDIWRFAMRIDGAQFPGYGAATEMYWDLLRERSLAMIAVLEN